jgi:hypothetical protein
MGEYDHTKAREWIQRMSGILELLECTKLDKMTFVTHFIKGDACNWWEGTKSYMMVCQMEMNWENFKRLFYWSLHSGKLPIPDGKGTK